MQKVFSYLRYTVRQLRRSPGLTAAVLLTFMLGIGVTTAVYTIVYDSLLAPLPYPQPQQLVVLWSRVHGHRNPISAADFLDWRRQSSAFQQLATWSEGRSNLATATEPEEVPSRRVTPGYFDMQGIHFSRGRDFLGEEGIPGKDHVVILTHKLWSRLGANPQILGQTLKIDQSPYTVVGVLAPGLADRLGPELITPLAFTPDQLHHSMHWLVAMARLKPGVTIAQAQIQMDAVAQTIAAAHPKTNTGWGASVEPLQDDFLPRDRIRNLWLLLGAVGFVLLITCVNIANLLLARGAARQKEIAVRSAMGASRATIFLQFLSESLTLAAAGGVLGIALGAVLLRGIVSLVPEGILPSEASFHLDPAVLSVALAVTVLAGVLFGSAPAWYASQIDPAEALKSGGRSGTSSKSLRARHLLIVGEFALALSLLTGAGLAIHSFSRSTHLDLGVRTRNVLTFSLLPPQTRFNNPAAMDLYYKNILSGVQHVPGVADASVSTSLPLRYIGNGTNFAVVGQSYSSSAQLPVAGYQSISPGYLQTYGIKLLKGRSLTEQDTATSVPVAVVNQEFVKRFLNGLDPLRQRLRIQRATPGSTQPGPQVELQIVGVTHDVVYGNSREPFPEIEVPFAQSPAPYATVGVHTNLNAAEMAHAISSKVHSIDPAIAVAQLRTLRQVRTEVLGEDRFVVRLFSVFALLALVLAAIGIHGLISYSVAQRTQELGLRLALGATRSHVTGIVLREALNLALFGLLLGLIGAFAVGRAMESTLYGVGPTDPIVILTVAFLLLATALIAAFLPARRAAAIDPMQALRTE